MATCCSDGDEPPTRAMRHGSSLGWLWLLVAAAWAVTAVATLTGQRYLVDHHFLLEESGLSWPVAALAFLVCWQVMIVAMMLPASMPTFSLMIGATRAQPGSLRARGAFYAGYAAMWTAFALLAFAGDTAIHHAVDASPWLGAYAFLIGAATLAGAGAYQFSGLKSRCLSACHNSWTLFARSRQTGSGPAWRLGAAWAGFRRLLLGAHAHHVRSRRRRPGLDGGADRRDGHRGGAPALQVGAPGARRPLLLLALLWLAHLAWLVPAGAA